MGNYNDVWLRVDRQKSRVLPYLVTPSYAAFSVR